MKKNFIAIDMVLIKVDDVEIDLHNDLNLHKIEVCTASESITVFWKPSGYGAMEDVTFVFSGKPKYVISSRLDRSDDHAVTLNAIGYLPPEDFGSPAAFCPEEGFKDDYHVIFLFEDDSFISVESEFCMVQRGSNVVRIQPIEPSG